MKTGVLMGLIFFQTWTYAARNPFSPPTIPHVHHKIQKEIQQKKPSLQFVLIHLHYADATEIVKLLKDKNQHWLTPSGSLVAETEQNSVWLAESPENIRRLTAMIDTIDRPLSQVSIQAYIVEADENFINELGVKFNTEQTDHASVLDQTSDGGQLSIGIAKLGFSTLLNVTLSALESSGHGKIIASPTLVTQDHHTAAIESGEEIPYQEKAGEGATSVAFKKAVLSLEVTPIITQPNQVLIKLLVNQDKVSPLAVQGMPAITTQKITTQVMVNSGQTVVLGGIYETTQEQALERVPVLSYLPGIGALFRHKKSIAVRRELLIFVTPRILKNN